MSGVGSVTLPPEEEKQALHKTFIARSRRPRAFLQILFYVKYTDQLYSYRNSIPREEEEVSSSRGTCSYKEAGLRADSERNDIDRSYLLLDLLTTSLLLSLL